MLSAPFATGLLRSLAVRALASDAVRCVSTSTALWEQQQPPKAKAPAKAPEDDFILNTFKEQMRQFRGMSAGLQKIPVPWDLDDKGIEKYITEVEGLKKKVGAASYPEYAEADMSHLFDQVGQNWRKFIKVALTNGPVNDDIKPVIAELEQAIDDIEAKTGKPLDFANPEGLKLMAAKAKDIKAKIGWKDDGSSVKEMTFHHYKAALTAMKDSLLSQMEEVKRSTGLSDYKIDLPAIQQRIISKAK